MRPLSLFPAFIATAIPDAMSPQYWISADRVLQHQTHALQPERTPLRLPSADRSVRLCCCCPGRTKFRLRSSPSVAHRAIAQESGVQQLEIARVRAGYCHTAGYDQSINALPSQGNEVGCKCWACERSTDENALTRHHRRIAEHAVRTEPCIVEEVNVEGADCADIDRLDCIERDRTFLRQFHSPKCSPSAPGLNSD